MFFSSFDREGYDDRYLAARSRIDDLCFLIVSGRISADDARNAFGAIRADYSRPDQENIELFDMIYGSRIERLCDQFVGGSTG